jgi:hypothetical protein
MSESLSLARWLAARDDDALAVLLTERRVPTRDLHDFFDVADALLDPASITAALRVFPREDLESLASPGVTAPPRAGALALALDDDGRLRALVSVAASARALLDAAAESDASATGDDAAASAVIPPAASTAASADALQTLAAEHAFATLTAASELVQLMRNSPLRLRSVGGLSATDAKRLSELLSLERESVEALVELMTIARLTVDDNGELVATTESVTWSEHPGAERWLALATAWIASLDEPYARVVLSCRPDWPSGRTLDAAFRRMYPGAGDDLRTALAHIDATAELLGFVVSGQQTVFARAALEAFGRPDEGGHTAADSSSDPVAAVTEALPAEIDRVYVQRDLTIIAPGPLTPRVDARIRLLADVETRGMASSYRVSQATIDRAFSSGETEASLRAFLSEASRTGIPQALDYLLSEGARRHGSVRVRPYESERDPWARSSVTSPDDALLNLLAVDQTLVGLSLRRAGDHLLTSRLEFRTAYWILVDARYPVVAEDADGHEQPMKRARTVTAPERSDVHIVTVPPATRDLVARLRATSASSAGAGAPDAWIVRQLDRAARAKTPVTIEVSMPGGATASFDVAPLGLSNGRFRCVDARAGVERTIPVSSILTVVSH